ncbi:unnamed protein product [Durusdinium trenchii]|uniref:Uncharacterized protein n=1 Tax=Durusdinium trenchii TaxID=1381693 RepID=A0ABP0PPE1_9DINO
MPPSQPKCAGQDHPTPLRTRVLRVSALAAVACLLAPGRPSAFVASPVRLGRVQRAVHVPKAAGKDADEGFLGDAEEEASEDAASPEFSVEESPSDESVSLTPTKTKADMARERLWNMPKEVAPYLGVARVTYLNKEKRDRSRNLVVIKAKNTQAVIEKSQRIIKHGTLSKIRMKRLMRHGRENFGRDTPWQWNRPGRRAFRMRSGMKDLRYADEKEKYQRKKLELRQPDWKRQRKRERPKRDFKWVGSSWKYGKGTRIARR